MLTYSGHIGAVNTVRLLEENNLGVSAGGDGQIHVWSFSNDWNDQNSEKPLLRLNAHQSAVNQVDVKNSDFILSTSLDQTAQIHDLNSGVKIISLPHLAPVVTGGVNYFKNFEILTGQEDGTVNIWDTRSQANLVQNLKHHRQSLISAKFLAEDKIITAAIDKTVRIFDSRINRCIETISILDGANCLSISPSGLILIPSDSRRLRIIRRNDFEVPKIVRLGAKPGHNKMISCSDWIEQEIGDPDLTVVTGGWDNKICLWRIPSTIIS